MCHINTYFLSSHIINGLDILRHPNYPAHLNRNQIHVQMQCSMDCKCVYYTKSNSKQILAKK